MLNSNFFLIIMAPPGLHHQILSCEGKKKWSYKLLKVFPQLYQNEKVHTTIIKIYRSAFEHFVINCYHKHEQESLAMVLLKIVLFPSTENQVPALSTTNMQKSQMCCLNLNSFLQTSTVPFDRGRKQAAFTEFQVTHFLLVGEAQYQSQALGMSQNEKQHRVRFLISHLLSILTFTKQGTGEIFFFYLSVHYFEIQMKE